MITGVKYCLADYLLSIKLPENFARLVGLENNQNLVIGGEGSYLDSITFEYNSDMVSTKGDHTGSWVHDINLDRTGKASISINQMSDKVAKFKTIVNLFYSHDFIEGCQLSLQDSLGNEVASGQDALFVKIPSQEMKSESDNQTWELTIGRLTFN